MMRIIFVALFMLCCFVAPVQAQRDLLSVPPPSATFPKVFPKYTKCKVAGKRQACYGKAGIKRLLLLWERYNMLVPVLPLARKQQEQLERYKKLNTTKTKQITSLQKALVSSKEAVAALRKKIEKDKKHRKYITIRNALITTGVVIVAVVGGVAIGYVVGQSK